MYLSKLQITLVCRIFYITKWLPVNLGNHQVSDNETFFSQQDARPIWSISGQKEMQMLPACFDQKATRVHEFKTTRVRQTCQCLDNKIRQSIFDQPAPIEKGPREKLSPYKANI